MNYMKIKIISLFLILILKNEYIYIHSYTKATFQRLRDMHARIYAQKENEKLCHSQYKCQN
jgi:hypothetical protein